MNLFYLDDDFNKSAEYHVDSHIIKIPLEAAQLLCTTNVLNGYNAPYKPTHKNHPMRLWTEKSKSNWLWVVDYVKALNFEYQYRYNKTCNLKSYDVIVSLEIPDLPDIGLTEFPQCMPENVRIPNNPVCAYRDYYIHYKNHLAKWKNRDTPWWYKKEGLNVERQNHND